MTPFLMSGRKGVARRVRPRSEKKRLKKSIEYNDADQATQSSLAGFITVTRFALNLLKVAYAVKSKKKHQVLHARTEHRPYEWHVIRWQRDRIQAFGNTKSYAWMTRDIPYE